MIIHKLISGGKNYTATIKMRLKVSASLILLGVTAMVVSILFSQKLPSDFFRGVYSGVGSGLLLGGLILFVTNVILLKNRKKAIQKEIEEKDERNVMIRSKSVLAAFYWGSLSMLVASLIAGMFSMAVFLTLLISVSFLLVIMFVSMFYYAKKY